MKAVRALALALALVLSGCLPVAMLRPPEPARGAEFSLGATLMPNPFANRDRYPVLPLPYLAYAKGDGTLEYNLSLQWGLRGGVKVGLAPGVALDAGLTLPPDLGQGADWSRWGVPVVLDGGVILGGGGYYLSPRLHLLGVLGGGWGLLYQFSAGVYGGNWVAEVGALGGPGMDGVLFSLSAAWRFGTSPLAP
ncbi:putative lipoprotein [Thermus thermophilus]|uniref:hypothetical protein n=1 Tax=Thermus thermophilus TaxID=274 RepID=UPI00090C4AE1|nr:hypothetical protein [Thermus thermophilus]BAW01899.1 putative lipoprotein [Thermus thermophilus]BDB12486.1 hypothetical protein TthTMY_22250 [Thermus thermophilus]